MWIESESGTIIKPPFCLKGDDHFIIKGEIIEREEDFQDRLNPSLSGPPVHVFHSRSQNTILRSIFSAKTMQHMQKSNLKNYNELYFYYRLFSLNQS